MHAAPVAQHVPQKFPLPPFLCPRELRPVFAPGFAPRAASERGGVLASSRRAPPSWFLDCPGGESIERSGWLTGPEGRDREARVELHRRHEPLVVVLFFEEGGEESVAAILPPLSLLHCIRRGCCCSVLQLESSSVLDERDEPERPPLQLDRAVLPAALLLPGTLELRFQKARLAPCNGGFKGALELDDRVEEREVFPPELLRLPTRALPSHRLVDSRHLIRQARLRVQGLLLPLAQPRQPPLPHLAHAHARVTVTPRHEAAREPIRRKAFRNVALDDQLRRKALHFSRR
mmetsp:Transcript_29515/g.66144  ORF Transcript_29515/g.66144 Transcript_29515/m.66144 type:complete len:290 (+) Transcript_29515:925-1794(+)